MGVSRKVNQESLNWFIEPENSLRFKRLITRESDSSNLSATLVEIDGKHQELKTEVSCRIYLIINGIFEFTINSNDEFMVKTGDLVFINIGDNYFLVGKGSYIVFNGPAFADGDDIYRN